MKITFQLNDSLASMHIYLAWQILLLRHSIFYFFCSLSFTCRKLSVISLIEKRLKNTIDLLLFYGEHISESEIYLFVSNDTQYETVFFIEIHVKDFYIQALFKCEALLLFLLIKTMVYRKNISYKFFFSIAFVKIMDLHVAHT